MFELRTLKQGKTNHPTVWDGLTQWLWLGLEDPTSRSRHNQTSIWRTCVITLIIVTAPCAAFTARALDNTRLLTQYGHSAWRIQDGVVAGAVTSLAQTRDGYLWVGTRGGLLRFNGVDLVPFKSPSAGEPVRSQRILSLLGATDGSLWIGTGADVEHWDAGQLTHYPVDVGYVLSYVLDIRQTHDGQIWIARSRVPAGEKPLCRIEGSTLKCFGPDEGIHIPYIMDVIENPQGDLIIHSDDQVIEWDPKSLRSDLLQRIPAGRDGIQALAFDQEGSLLIGSSVSAGGYGLSVLKNGRLEGLSRPKFDGSKIAVQSLYVDSHQAIWVGTQGDGLYRISGQQVAHYGSRDGLSSDSVNKILEDREGNIWIATQEGVDRFRDVKLATFSVHEGLAADQVNAVVASQDGSTWISNYHVLDVMRDGTVTAYHGGKELPGEEVTSLFEDRHGRMWVGIDARLTWFDQGEFRPVRGLDSGETGSVSAMTDDPQGNLWVISGSGAHGQLLRVEGGSIRERISFEQLPFAKAGAMASDAKSGIWLPMLGGNIAHWHDGQADVIALHRASHTGNVTGIIAAPEGVVYASSALGVIGVRGSTWQTLDDKNGLPCSAVRTLLWDKTTLWLYSDCGLLSVNAGELQKWWSDPKAVLKVQQFDSFDGVQPASAGWFPKSSKSPDGRLWFANASVLQMMDPAQVAHNSVAPLVQIENVLADGKSLPLNTDLAVRPSSRKLEFDYTSSSFAIPQKVIFRYQLDGYDKDWQEAGNRRQALYSNLSPGKYTFRVKATNNDGVWSTADATQPFVLLPAFYQTRWFEALCVAAILATLRLLYLARIRQVMHDTRMRVEARLSERERIARNIHDTLLQGIQGLMYTLQAATEKMHPDESSRRTIQSALDRADEVLTEGRQQIVGLRSGVHDSNELVQQLMKLADESSRGAVMHFLVSTEGQAREVRAPVCTELLAIVNQGFQNALKHSAATVVQLTLRFATGYLVLELKDDGRGIEQSVIDVGKPHHFGLQGMGERARLLSGSLTVTRDPAGGTLIIVSVPAKVAYKRSSIGWAMRWPFAVNRD